MNRVQLERSTIKQLLEIAKGLGIVGRWDMQKGKLVDKILEQEAQQPVQEEKRPTSDYVSKVEVGTLIAFKVSNVSGEKTISGKVVEKHSLITTDPQTHVKLFQRFLVVETKNKTRYSVKPIDVVWVKTGKRWPQGVFLALKGVKKSD